LYYSCGRAGIKELVVPLFHINALLADRSRKTIATDFPMEDLARIKRPREIEIDRCRLLKVHRIEPQINTDETRM
jgi:hypothetical protein